MNQRHAPLLRRTGLRLALAVLAVGPYLQGLFYWTQLLFAQALLALAFLLWLTAQRLEGRPISLPGGFAGGALLVLAGCYAVLLPFSLYPRGDLDWLLRTVAAWLLFVMMRQESTPRLRRLLCGTVVAAVTGVAVIGLLQYTGYFARDPEMVRSLSLVNLGTRLSATMQYPNTEAILFLMAILFAVGLAAERPRIQFAAPLALAISLLFSAFFFALSRGAVLVLPVALLLLFVGLPRGTRLPALFIIGAGVGPALIALQGVAANSALQNYVSAWRWLGAAAVAAAAAGAIGAWLLTLPRRKMITLVVAGAALGAVVLGTRVAPTMGSLSGNALGTSGIASLLPKQAARLFDLNLKTVNVQLRLNATRDALRLFAARPWGRGGAGWDRSYRQIQQFNYVMRETHNHYAQTAVEAGAAGAVALVAALVAVLWAGWRARRDAGLWAMTVAVAALCAHSLVDFNLSYGAMWLLLWAAAGLMAGNPATTSRVAKRPAHARLSGFCEAANGWFGRLPMAWLSAGVGVIAVLSLILSGAAWAEERSTALLEAANAQQALPLLQTARWLDPLNSEIAHQLARAYQAVGNSDRAIAVAKLATRLDGDYPLHWSELAQLLNAAGQPEPAIAAAEKTLDLQPMLGTNYEVLARMLSDQLIVKLLTGERSDAAAVSEKLVALGDRFDPDSVSAIKSSTAWRGPTWTPQLRLAYGQGLYVAGRLGDAQVALEEASKDPVTATQSEVWLYRLYAVTGNQSGARRIEMHPWVRFASINPLYAAMCNWESGK